MKDFQEPWHIGIFEDVDRLRYILEGKDFYDVGECNTPELAERVKVCVNSCKGINPEYVPDLLEAAKILLNEYNAPRDATAKSLRYGFELLKSAYTKARLEGNS